MPPSHAESMLQRSMHALEAKFWIIKNRNNSPHETNKNLHKNYIYFYFPQNTKHIDKAVVKIEKKHLNSKYVLAYKQKQAHPVCLIGYPGIFLNM